METWEKNLDKPFKCLNHGLSRALYRGLLLTKLQAQGFSVSFLQVIQNYLCNKLQRTKVNGSFSNETETSAANIQIYILGPIIRKWKKAFNNDLALGLASAMKKKKRLFACNFLKSNIIK